MKSDIIFEKGNSLKVAILSGVIEIVNLYSDLVNAMLIFLEKLV